MSGSERNGAIDPNEADFEVLSDERGAQQQQLVKKTAKHDGGVADLERVTDYAEEKEISSNDILGAISIINDRRSKENMEKAEREKELCKVTILKEHVDIIVREMEISRAVAEKTLRQHRGDVVAALTALTD